MGILFTNESSCSFFIIGLLFYYLWLVFFPLVEDFVVQERGRCRIVKGALLGRAIDLTFLGVENKCRAITSDAKIVYLVCGSCLIGIGLLGGFCLVLLCFLLL